MRIGVICALEEEISLLREYFVFEKEIRCGSIMVTEASLFSNRLFLTISGIGKTCAAIAAQALISELKCDLILNTGLAGSCDRDLHPGSAVLASGALYHDFYLTASDIGYHEVFTSDSRLNRYATGILDSQNFGYSFGLVATGDCFVSDTGLKTDIISRTGCMCVDMELAAIAHVASLNSIPYLSLKIISDYADEAAEEDFIFSMNAYTSYCSHFIYSLVKQFPYT